MVENRWFRALLTYGTSTLINFLPKSHNTTRKIIQSDFTAKKNRIRALLRGAKSDIHLSFDLWSSLNGLAINGIIAHFLGGDSKLKTVLLGL